MHDHGNSGGGSSRLFRATALRRPTSSSSIQSGNGVVIEDGGEAGVNNLEITNTSGQGAGHILSPLAICALRNTSTTRRLGAGVSYRHQRRRIVEHDRRRRNAARQFLLALEFVDGAHFSAGGTTHIPSALTWSQFASASNSNLDITGWSYSGRGAAGSSGSDFQWRWRWLFPARRGAAQRVMAEPAALATVNFCRAIRIVMATPEYAVERCNGGTGNATAAAHSIPVSEGMAAQNAIGLCMANQLNVNKVCQPIRLAAVCPLRGATKSPPRPPLAALKASPRLPTTGSRLSTRRALRHQSQPATSDLSDVTTPTAWTAADGSGESLTLTTSDTLYTKIGNVCTVSFAITYPTTANTNTAQISGIPAACTAKNEHSTGCWRNAPDGGAGIGVVYAALQKTANRYFFFNSGDNRPTQTSLT